jgi:4-amino-4-deoxy-L-arabinose transferase-like glycosyltransferase
MRAINSQPKRNTLLLLTILALVLISRLSVFCVVQSSAPSRILATDSERYYGPTAQSLYRSGRFSSDPENPHQPETVITPGYPAFIASIYLVFGENNLPVIVVQILISVGAIALTYYVAQLLWGPRPGAALISALLFALDFTSFLYSQLLLTETLFTFLLLLVIVASMRLISGASNKKWAPLLGIFLALSALVRPVSYYLVIPILVGSLAHGRAANWRWKRILATLLLIGLPWLALVGGWQLRNYRATGSPEFSHVKSINLLYYRGADIIAQRDGITLGEAQQKITDSLSNTEDWPRVKVYDLYAQEGMSLITHYPWLFAKSQALGLAKMMLIPGETGMLDYLGIPSEETGCIGDLLRLSGEDYAHKWLINNPIQFVACISALIYLSFLYGSAIYASGQIALARDTSPPLSPHILIWGITLYLMIVSAGPEAYSRFRVPIVPLLALFAGKGVCGLLVLLRRTPNTSEVPT